MGRPSREKPRASSADWPTAPCADPIAEEVRRIAVRLERELNGSGRSLRDVAAAAGTSHAVVAALLAGEAWPEVATVVRLERTLGAQLWARTAPN